MTLGTDTQYIQSPESAADSSTRATRFIELDDTPSNYTSGGNYFVRALTSGLAYEPITATLVNIDTSNLNYTGATLAEYLSNLDSAVNNAAQSSGGDPTTQSTVSATGALMNDDFTSNGILRRTGNDTYDVVDNGIDTLTQSQVSQLTNIGSRSISNTQWGYLSNLDQGVSTSDAVTFSSVNGLSLSQQSSSFDVAGGSSTTKTLTVDRDISASQLMTSLQDDNTPTLSSDLRLNGNSLNDTNNNRITGFSSEAAAVNNVSLGNAATGNTPAVSAEGSDTNVGLNLQTKGSGSLQFNGAGIDQNQWTNYLATTDQSVSSTSNVTFNTLDVADLATTQNNLGISSTGSAIELDTGNDGTAETSDLAKITTTGDTNSIFTNPSGDELRMDVSKNWPAADDVPDSAIDHNKTSNYNSNQHIDHTAVNVNPGVGMSGGGDLTTSRQLALNLNSLNSTTSISDSDEVATVDPSTGDQKTISKSNLESGLQLNKEQIQHSAVFIDASQGTSTSPYSVPSGVNVVSCDTASGQIYIQFQQPSNYSDQSLIAITDKAGQASTNPVLIQDSAGSDIGELPNSYGVRLVFATSSQIVVV